MNADPRIRVQPAPTPVAEKKPAVLETLLALEGEARSICDHDALIHFICNEANKLIACDQAAILLPGHKKGQWVVRAASSVSSVDRNAPAVRALEKLVHSALASRAAAKPEAGHASPGAPMAITLKGTPAQDELLMGHALLVPLIRAGEQSPLAHVCLLRKSPFLPAEHVLAARVGESFGHSLSYFDKARKRVRLVSRLRVMVMSAAIVAALAMFIPVPMSVLAPVEVVARDPVIITSPMEGVIASILVEPNQIVAAGSELLAFNDVDFKARLDVANRNLEVAAARRKRVMQGASASADMRREIAVSQAELALAEAERDEAQALYERTRVVSPSGGIAIFSTKDDWTGKPVSTGQRIMEIGDPEKVQFRISVALGDSVVLDESADVKVFLDNDPLSAFHGTIVQTGYRAETMDANMLAYRVTARLAEDQHDALLRIGSRGTARISNGRVSLGYYLFRRPISALRQRFGF